MAAGIQGFRLAMIQMLVGANKSANLQRAVKMVKEAAGKGAQVVSLPECFNSPYGTKYFNEYAESIPGVCTEALAGVAKECKIYLIGGTIPERDGDKIYNTCPVFGPEGNLLGKFRKVHLFDINVPGKIVFKESDVLSPGRELFTFDTEWCKVGVGICYDMRFPELAALYAKKGCKLLCYPGAFNMTTGPVHWELLTRARALDNQVYMAVVAPARDESASYITWSHSTLADPWGKIVVKGDEKEAILYADIDLARLDEVRGQIPITKQRRHDIYALSETS